MIISAGAPADRLQGLAHLQSNLHNPAPNAWNEPPLDTVFPDSRWQWR